MCHSKLLYLKFVGMDSFDSGGYKNSIITMKVGQHYACINQYVTAVRRKYWSALFRKPKFLSGSESLLIRSSMENGTAPPPVHLSSR